MIQYSSNESFYNLFDKLIKLHCFQNINQKDERSFKLFKSRMILDLLSQQIDDDLLSEYEALLWVSHELKYKRKLDDASNLLKCIEDFKSNGLFHNQDISNVIKFLLKIREKDVTNVQIFSVLSPWLLSASQDHLLPTVPLEFNDTRQLRISSKWHYTQFYSKTLFPSGLISGQNVSGDEQHDTSQYDFCVLNNDYSSSGFYGAMIGPNRKKTFSTDTFFQVPNLPCEHIAPISDFLTSVKARSSSSADAKANCKTICRFVENTDKRKSPNILDEGYASSHASDLESGPIVICENFWEPTLKYLYPPKYCNWENLRRRSTTEKPFISECGNEGINRLRYIQVSGEVTLNSQFQIPYIRHLSMKELVENSAYLVSGIPSAVFRISHVSYHFEIAQTLHVDGLSSETLTLYLQELLLCGSQVLRIESFCQNTSQKNMVIWSFSNSLKSFLLTYRKKICHLQENLKESHILNFIRSSEILRKMVGFVENLCGKVLPDMSAKCSKCSKPNCEDCQHVSHTRISLKLIAAFGEVLLDLSKETHLSFLALQFFSDACKYFFSDLEKWIYEGELNAAKCDFVIRVDKTSKKKRNREYWTDAFSLSEDFASLVPQFLKTPLRKALICGKTVNLIKLLMKQSEECLVQMNKHPSFDVTFAGSSVFQNDLRKYCDNFRATIKDSVVTLKEYDERNRIRRANLVNLAIEHNRCFKMRFENHQKVSREQKLMEKVLFQKRVRAQIAESFAAEPTKTQSAALVQKREYLMHEIDQEELDLHDNRIRYSLLRDFHLKMNKLEDFGGDVMNRNLKSFDLDLLSNDKDRYSVDSTIKDETQNEEEYNLFKIYAEKTQLLQENDDILFANSLYSGKPIKSNEKASMTCFEQNTDSIYIERSIPKSCPRFNKIDKSKNAISKFTYSHSPKVHQDLNSIYFESRRCEETLKLTTAHKYSTLHKSINSFKVPESGSNHMNNKGLFDCKMNEENKNLWLNGKSDDRKMNHICINNEDEMLAAKNTVIGPPNRIANLSLSSNPHNLAIRSFTNFVQWKLLNQVNLQFELVNEVLLSHLLVNMNLMEYFEVLKNFVLLFDASFARHLTSAIAEKFPVGYPVKFVSPVTLNILLEEARSFSSFNCELASKLTFFICNNPKKISCDAYDILDLRMFVEWPLNLVLDDIVLNGFAAIFKFLAKIHHVKKNLEDTFAHLQSMESSFTCGFRGSQLHQTSIYRHQVQETITVLFTYFYYEAIERSWVTFQRRLRDEVSTLDSLYHVVYRFLGDIEQKCFVSPQYGEIRSQIDEIIQDALIFANLVSNNPWRVTLDRVIETPAFSNIQAFHEKFNSYRTLLRKSLQSFDFSQHSHIENLFWQLCFNESYDNGSTLC